MNAVDLGERIGTLRLDGHPIAGPERPAGIPDYSRASSRYKGAMLLQEIVIQAVFEGADLAKITVSEKNNDDDLPQLALYAHPPVKSSQEGRLGSSIQTLLEKARSGYPGGALSLAEMDTFTPAREAVADTSAAA